MSWALKRQIFYISILFVFFGVFGFLASYPYLNKEPTCNDGKQNGLENGIDCGGGCPLLCSFQTDKLSIIWSRAFQVTEGRYNAVSYIENQNTNAGVYKIKYRFRFADKNNVYIGKREGEISIPPLGKFAIFEGAIDLGYSIPVYTTFEFTEIPTWINISSEKINQLKILTGDIVVEDENENPKAFTTIKNKSLFTIPELNVILILYDNSGNAISASRTYLQSLKGEETKELNFTWPLPFDREVVTKEIIPMYNIFNVKLK